ncbi:Casparian strip membrane protein [Sesbania bispinosa]|nr:Casparian strip membrane protein [Sesbania bispinosa]
MSSTIDIPESSKVAKAKAISVAAPRPGGWKKGVSIMDFILRLGAIAAAWFFVITMALVAGYLVLSLPLSIVTIVRPHAVGPRLFLIILDTVFLTLATASGSSAASIVYLAHNGNQDTNWIAICNQFGDFCAQTSGAVVSSFVTVVAFIFMIVMTALALGKH